LCTLGESAFMAPLCNALRAHMAELGIVAAQGREGINAADDD
jgi:hypothetical protein